MVIQRHVPKFPFFLNNRLLDSLTSTQPHALGMSIRWLQLCSHKVRWTWFSTQLHTQHTMFSDQPRTRKLRVNVVSKHLTWMHEQCHQLYISLNHRTEPFSWPYVRISLKAPMKKIANGRTDDFKVKLFNCANSYAAGSRYVTGKDMAASKQEIITSQSTGQLDK